jgi:putative endonuclease
MKFFYVYVIRSLIKDWIYVGYSKNLRQRIIEHKSGKSRSTSKYKPYELIHYEAYRNKKDAKRRELYLKTTKGKTTLRYMLQEYLK